MDLTEPDPRLTRSQWCFVASLLAAFLAFGVMVEVRSAFLSRRMGDLGVYLRAGWAVRAGADLYDITDDNGWHYNYPPLFAILIVPLADPPAGVRLPGAVPYAASVAIFYALNLVLLFAGVHALASALESTSAFPAVRSQPPFGVRWWGLRLVPVLVCLPPLGHTLMRGQANIVLLTLVCYFAAELLRGRRHRAGWVLAGAICLKIFPAFLLLYPLWRRDLRCLSGCAAGLIVGLLVVPVAAMGPERTLTAYRSLAEDLLLPALGQGNDHSRDDEIIKATRNDSQSFECVIHKTIHLNPFTRPEHVDPRARLAHRVLGVVFTLLTLAAARWRRLDPGQSACLFVGILAVLMVAFSPVCHTHYFALTLPLVMGLFAADRERHGTTMPGWLMLAVLTLSGIANVLPLLPPLELFKDIGVALYGAILLWLFGCVALWRLNVRPKLGVQALPAVPAAA